MNDAPPPSDTPSPPSSGLFQLGISTLNKVDSLSQTDGANLSASLSAYVNQAMTIATRLNTLTSHQIPTNRELVVSLKILALKLPEPVTLEQYRKLLHDINITWQDWNPTNPCQIMLKQAIINTETKTTSDKYNCD